MSVERMEGGGAPADDDLENEEDIIFCAAMTPVAVAESVPTLYPRPLEQ